MEDPIKEANERNKSYSKNQVNFTSYCQRKMNARGIEKEGIIECLFDRNPEMVEIQEVPFQGGIEKRHKQIYRVSNKYFMIVITSYGEKVLNVINVIKTSKDLEKKWRKKI